MARVGLLLYSAVFNAKAGLQWNGQIVAKTINNPPLKRAWNGYCHNLNHIHHNDPSTRTSGSPAVPGEVLQ